MPANFVSSSALTGRQPAQTSSHRAASRLEAGPRTRERPHHLIAGVPSGSPSVGHSPSPTPTATRSLSTTAPDRPNVTGRSPIPEDGGCALGSCVTLTKRGDRRQLRLRSPLSAVATSNRAAVSFYRNKTGLACF
jgi:hypothetical protein